MKKYFSIELIKSAIGSLEKVDANWLLPSFVFAANGVDVGKSVDLSKRLGTDQLLDRYFHGSLIGLPDYPSGNNLMRPRLHRINWNRGPTAGDYVLRQDTKAWGNLFSSRGYRDMKQKGQIEGDKAIIELTPNFKPSFEESIPDSFEFENLLIWLYAFSGFEGSIDSWSKLYVQLLSDLQLERIGDPYAGRFRLTEGKVWPGDSILNSRPSNEDFQKELAPKLYALLKEGSGSKSSVSDDNKEQDDGWGGLSKDDTIFAAVQDALRRSLSSTFLLAGPPGTGKTRYAHKIADSLTSGKRHQQLFLQFHPAFGYEDFVEGFRPSAVREQGSTEVGIVYKLERRHMYTFAERARSDPKNYYVMVIDELNRGDIARIFGEFLTYLEREYRGKPFTLAISGDEMVLPENLVVIATANPYDRSVTDLDDALLRRFHVIVMEPSASVLRHHLNERDVDREVISRAVAIFSILNEAFPAGFGHAAFLGVQSLEDLDVVWRSRVQLGLRRALIHDPKRYKEICTEIEQLLAEDVREQDAPEE